MKRFMLVMVFIGVGALPYLSICTLAVLWKSGILLGAYFSPCLCALFGIVVVVLSVLALVLTCITI